MFGYGALATELPDKFVYTCELSQPTAREVLSHRVRRRFNVLSPAERMPITQRYQFHLSSAGKWHLATPNIWKDRKAELLVNEETITIRCNWSSDDERRSEFTKISRANHSIRYTSNRSSGPNGRGWSTTRKGSCKTSGPDRNKQ